MDLDLTPKKYRTKAAPQRRRAPRAFRNWNNPFQMAIVLVALLAFVGTTIVERIRDQNLYAELFNRAVMLAEEAEGLRVQSEMLHGELRSLRIDAVLKEQTEREHELEEQISDLTRQIDERFVRINECFVKMPPRYRGKSEVQQWFIDVAQACIIAVLEQHDYEQARLWFNTFDLNFMMKETRKRVEGKGVLELDVGENIEEAVVIPVKSDGPRLVPCDPLRKSSEFPLVIPDIDKGSYLVWASRDDGTFSIFSTYLEPGGRKKFRWASTWSSG